MPNNLTYQVPASGSPVSTDEVNLNGTLVHVQRMKIAVGASGQYQADLTFGQAPAASSIPVVLPSGQAVLSQNRLGAKATYMASSNGAIVMTTGTATYTLAYLWHPNTVTKRLSLQKLMLTYAGGLSGTIDIALNRITGNGGGTLQTATKEDQDDPSTSCQLYTAVVPGSTSPTRDASNHAYLCLDAGTCGYIDLVEILEGKGLICRASQSEGWEVRAITNNVGVSPRFGVTFVWTEE